MRTGVVIIILVLVFALGLLHERMGKNLPRK